MIELTVTCDGCRRTIWLPKTTPPEKARGQLSLASVEWPRNVLCPHCNRVFAYLAQCFDLASRDMPDQSELRQCPVCVCIRTRCGDKSCTAHVRVSAVVNVSDDIKSDVVSAIANARYDGACCQQGHIQSGKPQLGSVVVELETDWSPSLQNE
jgi:hypothetical protein